VWDGRHLSVGRRFAHSGEVHRLAIVVLISAGCGRLGFDGDSSPPDATTSTTVALCESSSWSAVAFGESVVVSAVETPNGVTAAWAPAAGGDITAVNLDTSWQVTDGPTVTKTGGYRAVTITYLDGTVITGDPASDFSDAKIDTLSSDLSGGGAERACPLASYVGGPPMLKAGGDRITPVTRTTGLAIIPFDSGFSEMASQLSANSSASDGMSATAFADTAEVVWSTSTGCMFENVTSMATGTTRSSTHACQSPALAAQNGSLALVFADAFGVYLARGTPDTIDPATAVQIASNGTTPKVLFDGTRLWISYVASPTTLAIGFVDDQGTFHMTSIQSTAAATGSYDLVLVRGEPWLFVAEAELAAHRFCLQ
jgi:hypothetical protein